MTKGIPLIANSCSMYYRCQVILGPKIFYSYGGGLALSLHWTRYIFFLAWTDPLAKPSVGVGIERDPVILDLNRYHLLFLIT